MKLSDSDSKRYVGKFIVSEFKSPRGGKQVKRLYVHLPLEILEDKRFFLKQHDQLIVSFEEKGIMRIEKI